MTPVDAAPGIRRIRAANPSPLTGSGTNTYLLGTGAEVALIDPGPDLPDHLAAILAALSPGQRISHIFVTHPHRDHSALAPRLAAETGAPVAAFGTASDGLSARMLALARDGTLPSGEGADHVFRPTLRLGHGATVAAGGWRIEALHTPGHMGSHLCLAVGDVLFSGDHVMGWSTSVVAPPEGDMAAYMASLALLATRRWSLFLPGHGDPVPDPAARLSGLIRHRQQREAEILAALADGPATPAALALRIYTDIPAAVLPAAECNILAHLVDLVDRHRVQSPARLGLGASFSLCPG